MDATQLMKGILEGCVLAIIEKEETYGYQILSALEQGGFDSLSEGTLYPVLTRLDKNGYISCRRAKSPLGPIRKYYSITECKCQYKNVGLLQNKNVIKPTFLFCILALF